MNTSDCVPLRIYIFVPMRHSRCTGRGNYLQKDFTCVIHFDNATKFCKFTLVPGCTSYTEHSTNDLLFFSLKNTSRGKILLKVMPKLVRHSYYCLFPVRRGLPGTSCLCSEGVKAKHKSTPHAHRPIKLYTMLL